MYRCSIDVPRVTKPAGGRDERATNTQGSFLGRYVRSCGALEDVSFREAGARAQSPRVIASRQTYRVNFQVVTLLIVKIYKIYQSTSFRRKDRSLTPLKLFRGTTKWGRSGPPPKITVGFAWALFAQRFWPRSFRSSNTGRTWLHLILAPRGSSITPCFFRNHDGHHRRRYLPFPPLHPLVCLVRLQVRAYQFVHSKI